MELAVSCIAWEPSEDEAIADLLRSLEVRAVEAVPPRINLAPGVLSSSASAYRALWESRGIVIPAMQALLFGHPELHLFGEESSRAAMAELLTTVFEAGSKLGTRRYVFGSPKNRLRGELPMADAISRAAAFFRSVAVEAERRGGILCIEANPASYGCDFVMTSAEAQELVSAVGHPGFGLHLDTGGIALVKDDPVSVVRAAGTAIRHFHISAPNLEPIYDHRATLRLSDTLKALRDTGYSGVVSIEMRKGSGISAQEHVERAVSFVRESI